MKCLYAMTEKGGHCKRPWFENPTFVINKF